MITPPQTVTVSIVRGEYRPCKSCHWFNVCVVPRGNHFASYQKPPIRDYYQCEDYINNRMQTDESPKLNN